MRHWKTRRVRCDRIVEDVVISIYHGIVVIFNRSTRVKAALIYELNHLGTGNGSSSYSMYLRLCF